MKVLEVVYRTSWYVDNERREARAVLRFSAADEQADKLLAMDFSIKNFGEWQAVSNLQDALYYIEKLKNARYILGSVERIKEVTNDEFPLCIPKKQ